MARKPWATTRGPSTLPTDWRQRRAKRRDMAGGRCECPGSCGRHDGRCTHAGSECDHHDDDHTNHSIGNLRWLCTECHQVKSLAKAKVARDAARDALRHRSALASHPGMVYHAPPRPGP